MDKEQRDALLRLAEVEHFDGKTIIEENGKTWITYAKLVDSDGNKLSDTEEGIFLTREVIKASTVFFKHLDHSMLYESMRSANNYA